jgi:hypothetical protein
LGEILGRIDELAAEPVDRLNGRKFKAAMFIISLFGVKTVCPIGLRFCREFVKQGQEDVMRNYISKGILSGLLFFSSFCGRAATHYVDLTCTNPLSPYTRWSTAATNIQDAVDAASAGDSIVVTNGIYATGGRIPYAGSESNRVVADKAVTLRSVNGALTTVIQGYQLPGTTNGDKAIRCVYLTNGAALVGFTLTNGATGTNFDLGTINYAGGGTWCESTNVLISDCIFAGNSAYLGGGAFSGILSNCTFTGNSAHNGGGASHADLRKCVITGNQAESAGGAFCSTLADCLITSNSASSVAGGIMTVSLFFAAPEPRLTNCLILYNSADTAGGASTEYLSHCLVANNWARSGSGGVANCDVDHSTIAGNTVAFGDAGGASGGTFDYCVLSNNTASGMGGGVFQARLNHCLVLNNSAQTGGGAENCYVYTSDVVSNSATAFSGGGDSQFFNSILYYNTPEDNGNGCAYCCVSQTPFSGGSNFTNAPLFVNLAAGDLHLQPNSPCINSGLNLYVTNSLAPFKVAGDFDGNTRIAGGTVDVGPYEFQSPASIISYAWLQEHHLPTDGSVDSNDADHDGQTTAQEWAADTDPFDTASVFRLFAPTNSPDGMVVQWTSSQFRLYSVEQSTNLTSQGAFTTLVDVVPGAAGSTSITDTNSIAGAAFYRVSVQPAPF